jgi:protein-L-isoaspartate(D-aspartate) O-methyltransferase
MNFGMRHASQHKLVEALVEEGVLKSRRCVVAMRKTDRGDFIAGGASTYADHALELAHGQTISAPHMHAYALELLSEHLRPGSQVGWL